MTRKLCCNAMGYADHVDGDHLIAQRALESSNRIHDLTVVVEWFGQ